MIILNQWYNRFGDNWEMGKHVITLYISIKTLIFHRMEFSKWYAPKTWAGLRLTRTI